MKPINVEKFSSVKSFTNKHFSIALHPGKWKLLVLKNNWIMF